jgi:hypothetical protein
MFIEEKQGSNSEIRRAGELKKYFQLESIVYVSVLKNKSNRFLLSV